MLKNVADKYPIFAFVLEYNYPAGIVDGFSSYIAPSRIITMSGSKSERKIVNNLIS